MHQLTRDILMLNGIAIYRASNLELDLDVVGPTITVTNQTHNIAMSKEIIFILVITDFFKTF